MPSNGVAARERWLWQRSLYVLQAVGFLGLVLSYWHVAYLAVSFGAFDTAARVTLTTQDQLIGLYVAAFIIVDGWVCWTLRRLSIVTMRLLKVSFGLTVGLALFTIATAPRWENVLYFSLVCFGSGMKVFIAHRLRGRP